MAKRIRLTEMEAYNVKGKKSEPIGLPLLIAESRRCAAFLRQCHGLKSPNSPLTNLPK